MIVMIFFNVLLRSMFSLALYIYIFVLLATVSLCTTAIFTTV